MKLSLYINRLSVCPPGDSNPHAKQAADFKSAASTIPPGGQWRDYNKPGQPEATRQAQLSVGGSYFPLGKGPPGGVLVP